MWAAITMAKHSWCCSGLGFVCAPASCLLISQSVCREYRRPPSTASMELWRQRVGDCIGFDWDRSVQASPPTIVVIDREWNASRHIININHVMTTLKHQYPRANVELHYLETLNLKQQAVIYNRASIVMWVHGASMANLIFLPRRAVGLHVVPRPHIQENLDWPEELVRDLSHEVSYALCCYGHVMCAWTSACGRKSGFACCHP